MFRKSALEESPIYILVWKFITDTVFSIALMGLALYILRTSEQQTFNVLALVFIIAVGVELFLSLFRWDLIIAFANFLPLWTLALTTFLYFRDDFDSFVPFLLVYTLYTINSTIEELILKGSGSVYKGLVFLGSQAVKLILIISTFAYLSEKFPDSIEFLVPTQGYSFNAAPAQFYLILNTAVFIISLFTIIIILFYRIESLSGVGYKLKAITNWSLEDDIVEKKLLKDKMILKEQTRIVLFGDIRGFTKFTDEHGTKEVIKVLKGLYKIAEKVIDKHGGFKPEFIADEFITFFKDADSAVACVFELKEETNSYLKKFKLSLGLGMHKGKLLEGIVGGKHSKKYTVIGDTVNIAARLQSNAKGNQILISEEIIKCSNGLECEEVNGIVMKGVSPEFKVYELKGNKKNKSKDSK